MTVQKPCANQYVIIVGRHLRALQCPLPRICACMKRYYKDDLRGRELDDTVKQPPIWRNFIPDQVKIFRMRYLTLTTLSGLIQILMQFHESGCLIVFYLPSFSQLSLWVARHLWSRGIRLLVYRILCRCHMDLLYLRLQLLALSLLQSWSWMARETAYIFVLLNAMRL